MEIKIVKDPISRNELSLIAKAGFGDMVKAAVDIEKGIMAIGGELHADEETILVERCGSKRENVWGINLYPQKHDAEWIEFDSMINLKPREGNRSRDVENTDTQEKIKRVVQKLISE